VQDAALNITIYRSEDSFVFQPVYDTQESNLDRSGPPGAAGADRLVRWRRWGNLPRWVVVALAAGLLAVIVHVDIITGTDLSFAYAYIVPVLLVTWFIGRRAGYAATVVAVGVWLCVETHGGAKYDNPSMAYWNAATRLVFFAVAVALLSSLKNLRTRLESMVEERTQSLRRLASQLSEAEDIERRRLAYDIHDGFGQILSVLKLNLAAALPETSEGSATRQRVTDGIGMVNDLIDRSRTLTFDLHPAMLDHLGLVPTLHRYAEQFARRANVDVTVSEDGPSRPLPATIANYLFRSAKELLNNAAKHGHARQIVVAVHWGTEQVRIVIDDDGAGFDAGETLAPGVQKGLGLAGIRERLLSLGGNLRLESASGQGTRVVLDVPLPSRESSSL
jgi:signal transduction histidine kinase